MYKITTIPGDGIGLEVMKPTINILETTNAKFDFIPKEAGKECYKKYGTNLPEDTIKSCKNSDSTLFGAVTSMVTLFIPVAKFALPEIVTVASLSSVMAEIVSDSTSALTSTL